MMLDSLKEYDNVKRELETSMAVVRNTNNALYVGVFAVLAWAITASNSTLCLLTYFVIIPTYYIVLDYNIATIKLGSYLMVFHNDLWEKRLHEVNLETKNKIKRHATSYRNSFVCSSIVVTILFFSFLNYSNLGISEVIQIIICVGLFVWFNTYVFRQKNNDVLKQEYIDAWTNIKTKEGIHYIE